MPGPVFQDNYGHLTPTTGGTLVAGTAVAGAVGQITPGASLTAATVSTVTAYDTAGTFNFNGTYAGAGPGTWATVTYLNGFPNIPRAVLTNVGGGTSGHAYTFYAGNITANAFSLLCGGSVPADNSTAYTCQYLVIP
jgi:hypothetical protein